MLLEREPTLEALSQAVSDAAAGRGSVALVTGEAGIGKTSLVRAFAAREAERARLLVSACDDLMASRTLGPPRDVLGNDSVDDVFSALLDELGAHAPTVLVVEDIHWADDATLDVLGYAAPRIEPHGAALVLTCRDDEVDAAHPLSRFLGVLVGTPLSWATSCRRTPSIPARPRSGPSCCATSRSPARPTSRPVPGRAPTIRTSAPWTSSPPAIRTRCSTACGSSTASGPRRRPPARASGCASPACAPRAGRAAGRPPTRPGSPSASSPCSAWSPRG